MADYIFVIDTEQYAGNFERELVAHMTGQAGECGVGDDLAAAANKELPKDARAWFSNHVRQVADDENGCHRPAAIWATPGWFNDGHGNHHRDDADPKKVRNLRDRAVEDYAKETIEKVYADKVYAKKDADRFRKQNAGKVTKYPAYQSVACFLDAKPPPKILKLMKERCATFKGSYDQPTITGFRLLKQTTTVVEEELDSL